MPNAFDVCQCGHLRSSHFTYRASHHAISGCEVVVRPDGTGCRCRGFSLYHPRERGDDDGVEYADPRDFRDGLE